MTRGERNHNPLNIRKSSRTRWLGQTAEQTDREFVQFRADLFGYRAAFRILHTYLTLHGLVSLRQVIYRWAPPEDGNLTADYLDTVSRRSGVQPGEHLRFDDSERLLRIVAAMAWVESRIAHPDPALLRRAYLMARG